MAKFAMMTILAVLSFSMSGTSVYAIDWDGGGDGTTWSDPLNWVGDVVPSGNVTAYIPGAATVNVTTNAGPHGGMRIGSAGPVTLNVQAGVLLDGSANFGGSSIIGQGNIGTVNIAAGGQYSTNHDINVGENAVGTINVDGGYLKISREDIFIGANNGHGSAINLINGGYMQTREKTVNVGTHVSGATGTLYVEGSGRTNPIRLGKNDTNENGSTLNVGNAGILAFGLDAGGVDPILVMDTDIAGSTGLVGDVNLSTSSTLRLSDAGGAIPGSYTVIQYEGALVGTFGNLEYPAGWSTVAVDYSTPGEVRVSIGTVPVEMSEFIVE